jgi:hypothetical protein
VVVVGLVAVAVGAVVAAIEVVEQGTLSFTFQASVTKSKPMSLFLMISLEV